MSCPKRRTPTTSTISNYFAKAGYGKTTEHILPQNPNWATDEWAPHFTPEQHQRLRHSLGNLVLTYDNSSYGNKAYAQKRGSSRTATTAPSYYGSNLAQEREVALTYEVWTADQIQHRQRHLAAWAMKRWPLDPPATQTALVTDQLVEVGEDDTEDEAEVGHSQAFSQEPVLAAGEVIVSSGR